MAVRILSL